MLKKFFIVFSMGVIASTQALAEPWKGQADLGWLSNSGNSESTSLNAQLGLEKETEKWKHSAKLSASGNTSENDAGDDETTSEKYALNLKSDRNLSERSYLFGVADYTDDRFSGYEFQGSVGFGFGYKVIAEEDMTLMFELGPTYSHSHISPDNRILGASAHVEDVNYRIGEGFTWNFSETSELSQYATFEGGGDLETLKFGGFILSKLSEALSLKVGVDVTQRGGDAQDALEDADPELEDTDTTTYANISYSF